MGFIKRFLPFVLTFAAGLFIASFFVTVGLPKFGSRHRESKRHQMHNLKVEVEQLKKEKCDLKRQIDELKTTSTDLEGAVDAGFLVPPPPIAPVAPHRHK